MWSIWLFIVHQETDAEIILHVEPQNYLDDLSVEHNYVHKPSGMILSKD